MSNRSGHSELYRKAANGAKEEALLLSTVEPKTPTSWSRDGRFLLYTASDPKTGPDIWVVRPNDANKRARLLGTPAAEGSAMFSPNMRWMAYTSTESGGVEQVYVRELIPDSGESMFRLGPPQIVSRNGGAMPVWRGDGKELFYQAPDGSIMGAPMTGGDHTAGALEPGEPVRLFQQPSYVRGLPNWAVAPDGQRFLFVSAAGLQARIPFTVVVNWQERLGK